MLTALHWAQTWSETSDVFSFPKVLQPGESWKEKQSATGRGIVIQTMTLSDVNDPESAKPCWGALLQVGPRSEPRPPHAVKYRMTLVTRIAAPAQTAGYTANRVITFSSGCFNCPWFVLLNCPLLGLCHVTDTPVFLGVTGFAWCPRELPRFQ